MSLNDHEEIRKRAREIIARRLREFYELLKADPTTSLDEYLEKLELADDEIGVLGTGHPAP